MHYKCITLAMHLQARYERNLSQYIQLCFLLIYSLLVNSRTISQLLLMRS